MVAITMYVIKQGVSGSYLSSCLCFTDHACFLACVAYEVCKRRITALNACLPGIPQHFTENEREIHMSSLVPFDNISMVCNGILYSLSIHVILDFLLNPKVLIIASK